MGGGGGAIMIKHENALKRLKNIEGHLRGIQRMIKEDVYCIDVIKQILAVQAALNKVNTIILEEHLNSCVITAIRNDDLSERERVLKEIVDIFETSQKI